MCCCCFMPDMNSQAILSFFLVASVRNASVCPSIGPSIGPSVRPSNTHVQKPRFSAVFDHIKIQYWNKWSIHVFCESLLLLCSVLSVLPSISPHISSKWHRCKSLNKGATLNSLEIFLLQQCPIFKLKKKQKNFKTDFPVCFCHWLSYFREAQTY